MSTADRRAMVERPGKDLSVRRQCTLLNLARSGVYRPKQHNKEQCPQQRQGTFL